MIVNNGKKKKSVCLFIFIACNYFIFTACNYFFLLFIVTVYFGLDCIVLGLKPICLVGLGIVFRKKKKKKSFSFNFWPIGPLSFSKPNTVQIVTSPK